MDETPEQRVRRTLINAAIEDLKLKESSKNTVTVAEAMEQLLPRPRHTKMMAMDEENGIKFEVTNIEFEPHSEDDTRPDIVWVYVREA